MKPANRRWYMRGAYDAAISAEVAKRDNLNCFPPPGQFVAHTDDGQAIFDVVAEEIRAKGRCLAARAYAAGMTVEQLEAMLGVDE